MSRTNYAQTNGTARQEIPDEAPNANTSQAIGKVTCTKFVVGTDWESYTEQLDFYFLANGVTEPKTKKAVVLTNLLLETSDTIPALEEVSSKHASVFSEGLGKMKNIQARVQIKEKARPRFWKARPVALARTPAVDEALRELEAEGVIKKVATSEWAAPIVTPVKKYRSVRVW